MTTTATMEDHGWTRFAMTRDRVYFVRQLPQTGVWEAVFKARNPQTGEPWQQIRYVNGRDVHVVWLRNGSSEVRPGQFDPQQLPAGYNGVGNYFSTRRAAETAILEDAYRHGSSQKN